MLRSRCGCPAHAPAPRSAMAVRDAVTGRDPTGTRDIREDFVRAMNARWRAMRRLLVEAVTVHDIAGTSGASVASVTLTASAKPMLYGLDKVRAFQTWLDEALKQVVLDGDGAWVRRYIHQTYARAYTQAGQRINKEQAPSIERAQTLSSLTVVELQGVVEVVSQQVVRALSAGLLAHSRPMSIARAMARVVRTVGMVRGRATADTMVVRTHAEATLDAFQFAGVRRVGVLPERVAALSAPRSRLATGDNVISFFDAKKRRAKVRVKKAKKQKARKARKARKVRLPRVAPDTVFQERVEVLTAGDDDVCQACLDIAANGPYTITRARGLIPAHPWCRCAFVPLEDERFAHDPVGDAAVQDDFEEIKHPRDPKGTSTGGQFTSKMGEGGLPQDDPTKMGLIALYKRTIMLRKRIKDEVSHEQRALLKQKLIQTHELQRDLYAKGGNVNGVERVKAQLTKLGVKQLPSAPASFYKNNPLPTPTATKYTPAEALKKEEAAYASEHPISHFTANQLATTKAVEGGTIVKSGSSFKSKNALGISTFHATEEEAIAHLKKGVQAAKPASALGQYSAEETAVYNNLSHIGDDPKSVMRFAKVKMKVAPELSLTDASSIVAYSGSGYRKINIALRAGAMQEEHWGYVNNLNNALDKLPKHVGTVYRKADIPGEVAALYKKGMVIEERGFTSTSTSETMWSGQMRYEIRSKNGRNISHISTHPGEQEVLFKSGTRFRVKSVTDIGSYGKDKHIVMEEV